MNHWRPFQGTENRNFRRLVGISCRIISTQERTLEQSPEQSRAVLQLRARESLRVGHTLDLAYVIDDRGGDAVRRAAVVGSVMASYAVESDGVELLRSLSASDINARFDAFVELTRFHPLGGGQGLPVRAQFNN
mgnify:CR=1 FL=1